jgi:hypothetical protein
MRAGECVRAIGIFARGRLPLRGSQRRGRWHFPEQAIINSAEASGQGFHGQAVEPVNGVAICCGFGIVMNSIERLTSAPNLGFSLIGGALAGFLVAAEVSLLQPVIWALGSSAGVDDEELLRLSLRNTTATMLCCVAIGVIAGLVWALLPQRIVLGIRHSAPQLLPALWVLASFLWALSGPVPVIVTMPLGLLEAVVTLVLAAAAYFSWRLLLRWMAQGYIGRLVLTICATGAAL